jgi:hypothetical protein
MFCIQVYPIISARLVLIFLQHSCSAHLSVVAFGPRGDRGRELILNLITEKFDLSLRSTFSEVKQLRAVLQVKTNVRMYSYKVLTINILWQFSGRTSLGISTSTCFHFTAKPWPW